MKILVINGVNLNMLGVREKSLYGDGTYHSLIQQIKKHAKTIGAKVICKQSNYEGKIVDMIQRSLGKVDGIIINAGAYTHTSVAILDALKAVNIPTIEVHITDIYSRDEFRRMSYISLYAEKIIVGKGFDGYIEAIDAIMAR